jgi:hypothetical protein
MPDPPTGPDASRTLRKKNGIQETLRMDGPMRAGLFFFAFLTQSRVFEEPAFGALIKTPIAVLHLAGTERRLPSDI